MTLKYICLFISNQCVSISSEWRSTFPSCRVAGHRSLCLECRLWLTQCYWTTHRTQNFASETSIHMLAQLSLPGMRVYGLRGWLLKDKEHRNNTVTHSSFIFTRWWAISGLTQFFKPQIRCLATSEVRCDVTEISTILLIALNTSVNLDPVSLFLVWIPEAHPSIHLCHASARSW